MACLLTCLGGHAADGKDFFATLREVAAARNSDPGNADAARAVADTLVELGAPFGAGAALGGALDLGLRSRQAAARIRWGQQITPALPTLHTQPTDTDRAIAELQALLQEASTLTPPDAGLVTRLQRDLAVALRDRKRWADVLQTTQALRAAEPVGTALPAYVRQAEADALLALRRPAEARAAYADVLRADPQNREALRGRIIAEVEDEDAPAALASADQDAARSTAARRFGKDETTESNPDWLDAQVMAAQVRAYVDLPEPAWQRLLPLALGAPALPYLRSALASVAAQRGWPRRSAEEAAIALSLAPDDTGMQLAQAESDTRRRQWHSAQAQLDRLAQTHPDMPQDPGLQRAQRDLDQYRAPELRLEFGLNRDDSGGVYGPGAGSDSSALFYTPPLGERCRVAGAYNHSRATLPEGEAVRERVGLGLEGRWPDLTLEAFGWNNSNALSASGSSLQVRWEPSDLWSLQASSERVAADTPLRALVYGISANLLALSGAYRWDETRAADLELRSLAFSDGNQRQQASASLTQQVLARPGLRLQVGGSLSASTNSLAGTPYFNPSSDRSLTLTAGLSQVLWRSYERSWQHSLELGVGRYNQAGFASADTASLRYSQELQTAPWWTLRYGLDWARRIYDGQPEQALRAFVAWEHHIR